VRGFLCRAYYIQRKEILGTRWSQPATTRQTSQNSRCTALTKNAVNSKALLVLARPVNSNFVPLDQSNVPAVTKRETQIQSERAPTYQSSRREGALLSGSFPLRGQQTFDCSSQVDLPRRRFELGRRPATGTRRRSRKSVPRQDPLHFPMGGANPCRPPPWPPKHTEDVWSKPCRLASHSGSVTAVSNEGTQLCTDRTRVVLPTMELTP